MRRNRCFEYAKGWQTAVETILAEAGHQFDPQVVAAFADREPRLREIRAQLAPQPAH